VERENIMAKQDGISLRAALEQERKRVKYIILTPWCRGFFEEFVLTHLLKKLLAFITVFSEAYPEPVKSIPLPKIHFNVIFPSGPWSPKWSFPLDLFLRPHACHMPHPSCLLLFNDHNKTRWKV
jgi:hypothetical protein